MQIVQCNCSMRLLLTNSIPGAEDPWGGTDKLQHFVFCFVVTVCASLLCYTSKRLQGRRLLLGCSAGLSAGVAKEVGDFLQVIVVTCKSLKLQCCTLFLVHAAAAATATAVAATHLPLARLALPAVVARSLVVS
jgi:uncharacterized protein YfiM (DUF2279 family)